MAYLTELTKRLLAKLSAMDPSRRQRHAAFLVGLQNADGGFSGRQGPSNPYYTSFALRALALAGSLTDTVAHRAARYLRQQIGRPLALVDLVSVVFAVGLLEAMTGAHVLGTAADIRRWLWESLEALRRPDGGYAKTADSSTSSTYGTFLAVVSLELLEMPIAAPQQVAGLIRSRQRPDGGFVELDAMRHGGTNPTAAAVAVLRVLDACDTACAQSAARFLLTMQNAEGGFRAHARIPLADLLSTFTALAALEDLGVLAQIDAQAARRFIAQCEDPQGGFGGGWGDAVPDAEYTFYGLGGESLLSAAAH